MLEKAGECRESRLDGFAGGTQIPGVAHHETENGIDRRAAMDLRIDAPVRKGVVEEALRAQQREQAAPIQPVVPGESKIRQRLDVAQGRLREGEKLPVRSGVVLPQEGIELVQPAFAGHLREEPMGFIEIVRSQRAEPPDRDVHSSLPLLTCWLMSRARSRMRFTSFFSIGTSTGLVVMVFTSCRFF